MTVPALLFLSPILILGIIKLWQLLFPEESLQARLNKAYKQGYKDAKDMGDASAATILTYFSEKLHKDRNNLDSYEEAPAEICEEIDSEFGKWLAAKKKK